MERKVRSVRESIKQITAIDKNSLNYMVWETYLSLISSLMAKWNHMPYSRQSSLSPESFVHPYSALQDVNISEEIKSNGIVSILRTVMQTVTSTIHGELLQQNSLDAGRTKNKSKLGTT